MIAVNIDHVTYSYFRDAVFSELSWEIHDDRVVGLVGPNGCGKSTLLKLIAGELAPDSGFLARQRGLSVGYLPQDVTVEAGRTIWEVVLDAGEELAQVERALNQVEQDLHKPEVYGDERLLSRSLEQQQSLLAAYERLGGPGYEGRVRSILADLGFSAERIHLRTDTLSGGEKKLVGLACLLIRQPRLLLLDEPDNHLDMQGKAFLEQFIRNYPGAVLIVSHDRYLLDLVVDEIAELEDGMLTLFPGNYSEYAFEKQMSLTRQQQIFKAQQKEITRLEQTARRLMLWGRLYDNNKFIRRGQSIMKRLDKIERIDKPMVDRPRMQLELAGWTGSQKVLEVSGLRKGFHLDDGNYLSVLDGLNLLIMHGERVGLVGANGAGKSLLFRILLGQEQADAGTVEIGPSIRTANYAQEHETLQPSQTVLDTIRFARNFSEQRAVAFLKKFLFGYRQTHETVNMLSGGERSRLQMALLMLSGANFLLLDEPTNHLDIASAEVLEDALQEFEGTVLVISHDRYFLDRVATRIVDLETGLLTSYGGGYSDYQAAKNPG